MEAIRSGIDLSHVDDRARPQDDLFGYVNGRWLADYAIPADRATDGAFRSLYDRAEEQIRELIAGAAYGGEPRRGTDQQRIGDLFASFTDEATVERIGVTPLLDELAAIDEAADADALAAVIGALQRAGVGRRHRRLHRHRLQGLDPLPAAPEPVRASGCPTSPTTATSSTPRSWPPTRVTSPRCSSLVYGEEASSQAEWQATAERVVALEAKLAGAHWDVVKRRDADLTYNLRQFTDLPDEAPGFDWAGWVTAMGASPSDRPPKSLCANLIR